MKVSFFALLMFLMLNISFSAPAQTKKDIALIDKGNVLLQKGDYKGVIKVATEYIDHNPTLPEGYLMRGLAYANMGNSEEAVKDYTKSIRYAPDFYLPYYLRGSLYRKSKSTEKAIADYNNAIKYWEADGDSSQYFYMMEERGACKLMKRDFTGAEADYMITYWQDTTAYAANVNLGVVYMETAKYDKAMYHMSKALEADPNDAVIMNNMGYLCNLKGEYAQAIPYLDKCIKTDPKMAYAYSNRGLARYKTGDTKGGLEDVNYAIKLDPSDSYAFKNLAIIQIGLGKTTEACASLEKALELGYSVEYGYEAQELYNKNCKQ